MSDNGTLGGVDDKFDTAMKNTDGFFLVVMAIFVSLMQCGFAFLEAGAVR
jgi:Amt family ammonium transporter